VPQDAKTGDDRATPASQSLRGRTRAGCRAYNQRLVLSLVYAHGNLAKTDISRMTGLSAQTGSVLMRELEAEDLIVKGEPIRGKVGQPSVPLSINPDGAFFIGLKVGRRSAELILIDFLGQPESHAAQELSLAHSTADHQTSSAKAFELLIHGMPGIFATGCRAWHRHTVRTLELGRAGWRAARGDGPCGATAISGRNWHVSATCRCICRTMPPRPVLRSWCSASIGPDNYLYLYIGTFVGGGVVLNGSVYSGRTGNAGALGPLPVTGPDGTPVQLLDRASIMLLERMLRDQGTRSLAALEQPENWQGFRGLADDMGRHRCPRPGPGDRLGIIHYRLRARHHRWRHSGRCPGKAGGGDPARKCRTTMSAASRCPPSCPEPWGISPGTGCGPACPCSTST
jgi:hypothetical protein